MPNFTNELSFGDFVGAMQERGQFAHALGDERRVCEDCFTDEGVKKAVRSIGVAGRCAFCRRKRRSTALFLEIVPFIFGCIASEYEQPEDVLLRDPESETGWAGSVYDTADLLSELSIAGNTQLFDALLEASRDRLWTQDPGEITPVENLQFGWDKFCRVVKHHSRYMFWRDSGVVKPDPYGDDTRIHPSHMLEVIGNTVKSADLLVTLESGHRFYRARRLRDGDDPYQTAEQLGPPASEQVIPANRMSAAGVPMFYAASNIETAIKETCVGTSLASVGQFAAEISLSLLDLTNLSKLPYYSIFENATPEMRAARPFLESFRDSIMSPVQKDGREHTDYVPSQIVTEYFRFVFRDADGRRVRGIRYPSAQSQAGWCVVLFATRNEVAGLDDYLVPARRVGGQRRPLLRFVPNATRHYAVWSSKSEIRWRPLSDEASEGL